jgi:predicted transcriptional regulator
MGIFKVEIRSQGNFAIAETSSTLPQRDRLRRDQMASTTTVRISKELSKEVAQIAALRGQTSGDLLAKAWKEFLARNKDAFAKDMEEAAQIIRTGTTTDLAAFLSEDVDAQAEVAAEQAQQAQS